MNKDIININDKGELHGYQQLIDYNTNKIYLRAIYKNTLNIGYNELHSSKLTYFYIR